MTDGPPKTVLMADDDTEDCMLATEAFTQSGSKAAFSCVLDGIELMDHLKEHSRSEAERLPDLSEDGLELTPCIKKGGQVPFWRLSANNPKGGHHYDHPGKTRKT